MPVCDGCGVQADDAHIRRRIVRLELATRFRPIHIHVLLIDAAPPPRLEDYFYRPAGNREERSVNARYYLDEIVKCSGFAPDSEMAEETALAEFQHRGFYLAHAVECPIEPADALTLAIERAGPVLIRRIEKSYKPKYVALLSTPLAKVIPLFERTALHDRLLLNHGEPFSQPIELPEVSTTGLAPSLSDALSAVLPHST
ncbi:MAG: hypothetical protein ABSB65_06315 [Candidatus Acidiferrales bacterium]|jgi:hypothetical protein